MNVRAAILAVPLAALAGCATAPRTTYHYDGTGDYYSGVTPGADVVVSTAPGHGYPGWGYGYGGWAGAGFGYGSSWWYGGHGYGGWPWWYWHPIQVKPPRPTEPRVRSRSARTDFAPPREAGDAASRRIGALPSSAFAPERPPAARRGAEPAKPGAMPRLQSQHAPARAPSFAPPPPPRSTPSFERAAPPARAGSKRE